MGEEPKGDGAPKTPEVTPQPETDLSKTIAEIQSKWDADKAELEKHRAILKDKEGHIKKLSAQLKENGGEKDQRIDALQQQLDIAQQGLTEREERIKHLTHSQVAAEVQRSVMSHARVLDEARADLSELLKGQIGVVDGRVTVLTPNNTERLSAKTGKGMTVDELIEETLGRRPYMQKPITGGGTGGTSKTDGGKQIASIAEVQAMTSDQQRAVLERMQKESPEAFKELLKQL